LPALAQDDGETLETVVVEDAPETPPLDYPSAFSTVLELGSFMGEYNTASEILSFSPGVVVRDYGGFGQLKTISIRGSSNDQVVILLDGVRLNSPIGGGVDLTGVALCIVGVISLAVATLMVRGAASGGNLLMVVGLQMLIGSAILWPISLATETMTVIWSWQLIVAFAYTTLVPGLLATWVWFVLVGRIGAVRAATFHFLNPVFGAAVASVLLRESLSHWDLIGIAVVTVGILLVQMSKQNPR